MLERPARHLVGALPQIGADDQDFGTSVVDDRSHLARGEPPVDGAGDGAGLVQREEELDVMVRVLVQDRAPVAWLEVQLADEPGRELRARAVHLCQRAFASMIPGDREVWAPARTQPQDLGDGSHAAMLTPAACDIFVAVTRALVLGGGGVTGIAWELGMIAGLAERGIDLASADLVVGTSAGSVVGAQISRGRPIEELYTEQLADPNHEIAARMGPGALLRFLCATAWPGDARRGRAWPGRGALAACTLPEAERRRVI